MRRNASHTRKSETRSVSSNIASPGLARHPQCRGGADLQNAVLTKCTVPPNKAEVRSTDGLEMENCSINVAKKKRKS